MRRLSRSGLESASEPIQELAAPKFKFPGLQARSTEKNEFTSHDPIGEGLDRETRQERKCQAQIEKGDIADGIAWAEAVAFLQVPEAG